MAIVRDNAGLRSANFQALQKQFGQFIRQPEHAEMPAGIEPRRMKIYSDLFFNNVSGFIDSAFPVAKKIFSEARWLEIKRQFFASHRCESPYFAEISFEFLKFLQNGFVPETDDPAFLLELAHYEWVELALDIAEDDIDWGKINRQADLLNGIPYLSPLAWLLNYQYPVHKIGPQFCPTEPPLQPTFLIVYRDSDFEIGFMEVNYLTALLVSELEKQSQKSGFAILQSIYQQSSSLNTDKASFIKKGAETLENLKQKEIILGSLVQASQ